MKIITLVLIFSASVYAQSVRGQYAYEKETSLTSAAETVTIHLATGSSRTARMVGATAYCSVACTVTLKRDGTAPTATAATATKLNTTTAAAGVVPYYSSDVGTSTTLKTYTLSAGEEKVIDLSDKGLLPGENLTLVTSSITGTARLFFQWREY